MKSNNYGNSLIEIIIALAIFSWLAASLTSLMLGSFSLLNSSGSHTKAEFIAQEGIEAVNAIKSRSWHELNIRQSALQIVDGQWVFGGEGTSEQIGDYSRTIFIDDIYRDTNKLIVASSAPDALLDKNTKKITSKVNWLSQRNNPVSVEFATLISNWNMLDWMQGNWNGGDGQQIWEASDKFQTQDGDLDIGQANRLSLLEIATSTLALEGSLESSEFFMGEKSEADSIVWKGSIDPLCTNCSVELRLKTAGDDGGSPGTWTETWSGPDGNDGDEDDFYSASTSPELIHSEHYAEPWIKYKVTIYGDSILSPVVESIIISYKK